MNYENMTTQELKKTLLKVMQQRETPHYMLGWLSMAYVGYGDEDTERTVAIMQLKKYEV
jgi:hypothetical protein